MRGWLGFVVRLVVSAVVLLLLAAILPGFRIAGFRFALLGAVVIAALGWLVEALFGRQVSPQGRGIVGFIVAAAVIYLAQFLVPGMQVSMWGALLASLIIGIVDAFVPTELR
jgi:putative membrane protein